MAKNLDIDATLALILDYVKEIVEYFTTNKNGQDASSSSQESDLKNGEILKQISETMRRIASEKTFTEEQAEKLRQIVGAFTKLQLEKQDEIHSEFVSLFAKLEQKLAELANTTPQKSTLRHEHYFTVDFKNSKAAITMTTMAIAIIVSVFLNFRQAEQNDRLRDNDLKYRCIKMLGSASEVEILTLEKMFNERNKNVIKELRKQVEEHERIVLDAAQSGERARLNAIRADSLRREAEAVRKAK